MCDCIDNLNSEFEKQGMNTRIKTPVLVNMKTFQPRNTGAVVATEKADSGNREKPKMLFAAYCPFCGEKYEQEKK